MGDEAAVDPRERRGSPITRPDTARISPRSSTVSFPARSLAVTLNPPDVGAANGTGTSVPRQPAGMWPGPVPTVAPAEFVSVTSTSPPPFHGLVIAFALA